MQPYFVHHSLDRIPFQFFTLILGIFWLAHLAASPCHFEELRFQSNPCSQVWEGPFQEAVYLVLSSIAIGLHFRIFRICRKCRLKKSKWDSSLSVALLSISFPQVRTYYTPSTIPIRPPHPNTPQPTPISSQQSTTPTMFPMAVPSS